MAVPNSGSLVARHRTAIARKSLSQPIAIAMAAGLLGQGISVLDYGCGRGDDLAALRALGIHAFGWDPYYAPAGERQPADLVNLGYVLNVIEDPVERAETLRAAWSLARKHLVIAVRVRDEKSLISPSAYSDGVLTQAGTFQKFFDHSELITFVTEALGVPVGSSLAAGIVVVHRDR